MEISTDKEIYTYGDSIEVKVKISNNTDSTFSIWGSTTCIVRIGFNSVPFQISCTSDYTEFIFQPNSSRTWIWNLIPSVLGIPDKNGLQMLYSSGGGLFDSVSITAPKYYGGRVRVNFSLGIPFNEIQNLRDSINASVISSDTLYGLGTITEKWQIENYTVDSLANIYSSDPRFNYFQVSRPLQFNNVIVTSTSSYDHYITDYILFQNYPNPFNPNTTIEYFVPNMSFVTLKIFDVLGNELYEVVNEEKMAGKYEIKFNAESLSSGVYFYTLQAGDFLETKKLILLK